MLELAHIFLIYKIFSLFLVFIFNSALDLDTAVKPQYDEDIAIVFVKNSCTHINSLVLRVILVEVKNYASIPQGQAE